ncbi:phosphotransferase [Corynebacterium mayonis]|uniref:phosphotransferase n=1 Tax=Corynebacterium mayonis TaxID=3062461 RepID=UPI003140A905
MDLSKERFYGAKSEAIDSVRLAARRQAGQFEWQLLDVTHNGTTDTYQVLVGGERDVLSTPAGAQAYLDNAAVFGTLHGTVDGVRAVPLGAEQSNTSLVIDDAWVLKVFRRLERGINPDVELLSAIADCPHVAGVRGYVTRDGATLAMQQEFIDGGVDGFDLATSDAGLDDPSELGEAIRVVHDALAARIGTETVPGAHLSEALNAHLDRLVVQAPVLREFEARLRALYADIAAGEHEIQRVHGDLHLGQTLKTDERWYVIDFEGEPARPLQERRALDHRLRDLAGMVRSFGYAAAVGAKGEAWRQWGVDKLCAGYGVGDNPLLAAYVADKAAYEVAYEANNRPEWVEIPLGAIRELLA